MGVILKNHKSRCAELGFSLIELSITLVIIGVLATPLIQQYNLYKIDKITKESRENLTVVRAALQKFAVNNGRYPLPSDKNKVTNTAGYGEESTTPLVACTPTSSTICRTTVGSLGSAGVLIGAVPFSAIGIPEQYTFDGYKRKFTYAVTQSLTAIGTFSDSGGVIRLIDNAAANHDGTTNNIQFVLVSHGPNGKGAPTINGTIAAPCTGIGADLINCDNDAIFNSNYAWVGPAGDQEYRRLEFGTLNNATYFDDYVEYATSTTSDIWTMNANAVNADIYRRNPSANVKIGEWGTTGAITEIIVSPGPPVITSPRAPTAKVDVAGNTAKPGNVKAQRLLTNRLCTFTENAGATAYVGCVATTTGSPPGKAFAPSIIGGTPTGANMTGSGIDCGTGTAMTGIKNADETCNYNYIPPATLAIDSSCDGTKGGQKIIGGKLYCGI